LLRDLKSGFKAAMADPDLTALNGELALLEGRIGQLLRKLSETEAPTWTQALSSLADLDAVVQQGDLDRLEAVLARHADVVRSGADASPPNRTGRRRWGMAFRVIPPEVVAYGGATSHRVAYLEEEYDLTKWGAVVLRGADSVGVNRIHLGHLFP
jgi:hypothetical protein